MTETKDASSGTNLRSVRTGKQTLVVRHGDDDFQRQVIDKLAALEARSRPSKVAPSTEEPRLPLRLDTRTIVAVAAIVLSIAGYVIQDARNSSRQDAEIETAKVRLSNLERIAATNTESRIRTEVELSELREGQAEIKQMLQAHQNETLGLLHKNNPD